VGDAPRQSADALQPLGSQQLGFDLLLLGQVRVDQQDRLRLPTVVRHQRPMADDVPHPAGRLNDRQLMGPRPGRIEFRDTRGHQRAVGIAEQFAQLAALAVRARPAEELGGALVPIGDRSVRVGDADRIAGLVQQFRLFAEPLLRRQAQDRFPPALQRRLDRRDQPSRAVLDDVIDRALVQSPDRMLFADRARQKQERNLRRPFAHQDERFHPGVGAERIIGDDDVKGLPGQGRGKFRLGRDAFDQASRPFRLDAQPKQGRVDVVVLQVKQSQGSTGRHFKAGKIPRHRVTGYELIRSI